MKDHLLYFLGALFFLLAAPLQAQVPSGAPVCVHLKNGTVDIFPDSVLTSKQETATQWKFKLKDGKVFTYNKKDVERTDAVLPADTVKFTLFKFNNKYNENVYTDVFATIGANEITATIGAIGKSLTPSFQLNVPDAKVYVGNEVQESKVSRHRFDKPIVYTIAYPGYRMMNRVKVKDEVWSEGTESQPILEKIRLTPNMLSTNAPSNYESTEGLQMLVDDNPRTFFHSTWGHLPHANLPLDECPFVQVNLQEDIDNFVFSYITRSDNDTYNPRSFDVEYSKDGVQWSVAKSLSEADGMPMFGAQKYYQLPVIELPVPCRYLRFKMTEGSHKNYLVLSQLDVYRYKGMTEGEPPHLISPAQYEYKWKPYGKEFPVKIKWLTDEATTIPSIHINIENGKTVQGKTTYYKAAFELDGAGVFPSMKDSMLIKGRGNISLNYPKKSYRLKFATSVKPFGLTKGKNWVLLANYQQDAMLANVVGMKIARMVGTAGANDIVPVELYVNGQYQGNYNFTQHVGLHNNSVDIVETDAVLLEMDTYDDIDYKFVEKSFNVPAFIKSPDRDAFIDDQSRMERYAIIQDDFNALTSKIAKGGGWESYVNMPMLARYLLVNELVENTELKHPKSCYVYREDLFSMGSKYVFGPVWDLDWAYGYENNRSCCVGDATRDFYNEILGHEGGRLFTSLRQTKGAFQRAYYKEWKKFMDNHLQELGEYIQDYYLYVRPSFEHNQTLWGTGSEYYIVANSFKNWIDKRASHIYSNLESFDLNVPVPIEKCDVNKDGYITLADAVCVQNMLLGLPNETYDAYQADANSDGNVSVTDIVWIVAEAMNQDPDEMRAFNLTAAEARLSARPFTASLNQTAEMPLTLEVSEGNYVAAQFDVNLPEGMVLADLTLPASWNGYHAEFQQVGEQRYRVAVWAEHGEKLPLGKSEMLLQVRAERTVLQQQRVVSINGMTLVNALGEDERVSGKSATFNMNATGVDNVSGKEAVSGGKFLNVETLSDGEVKVYGLDGRMVKSCKVKAGSNRIVLPEGVYLVNNQKVVINH